MAGMDGKCDFARDVAFLYPLHVIMEVLGVPEVDEPLMMRLTQELFGSSDPDLNRASGALQDPETALAALQSVIADFITYFNALTESRRKEPKEDVATVIANGTVTGHQPLGAFEAMSYYIIVATAGHDTTSSTTAHALWALAENPDQFRK